MQDHYEKMYRTYEKMEKSNIDQRILQAGQGPQPIRITTDYTMLNQFDKGITEQQKNYLINLMETSILYFQRLLKVYQLSEINIFPKIFKGTCIDHIVSNNDQTKGIPKSDLHIYVRYSKQFTQTVANAGFCAYSNIGYTRPTFGRINFNLLNINKSIANKNSFQEDLQTTIHEILHVLGFSGGGMYFWIDPNTGQYYGNEFKTKLFITKTYRGKKTILLTSKNIVEVTRKYYNCRSAEGMQFENNEKDSSMGSHWERTVIYNEIMTGTKVFTNSVLSIFTIALLKDTGFYPEVNENMADNIFWGKGKGCDFLENACQ
ncbi:leishmanolysin family protein, putative, partial [Ichthyophthirius multifiliis]